MAWWEKYIRQRDLLENMKIKYSLTEEEKEAIDYATFLIQKDIDGEVD